MGERNNVNGPDPSSDEGSWPNRKRARFSTRESARPTTPPLRMALATEGEPRVALVTPVTVIPLPASRSTRVRALWQTLSRSISNRGAVMAAS